MQRIRLSQSPGIGNIEYYPPANLGEPIFAVINGKNHSQNLESLLEDARKRFRMCRFPHDHIASGVLTGKWRARINATLGLADRPTHRHVGKFLTVFGGGKTPA
jgi:hypothetical protein